jgi:hypothetical protein
VARISNDYFFFVNNNPPPPLSNEFDMLLDNSAYAPAYFWGSQSQFPMVFGTTWHPLGINNKKDGDSNINVFPNPILNVLNVQTAIKSGEIQIFNSIGKKIVSEKFYSETSIDMSAMSPGIYMVQLIDLNSNRKYFEKIVLKK